MIASSTATILNSSMGNRLDYARSKRHGTTRGRSHQYQEAIAWVEGRVVQEAMMALFESSRKRQRIDLPLKTRLNPLSVMVKGGELPMEWTSCYKRRSRIVRGEAVAWPE